jgi:hypothetical protein
MISRRYLLAAAAALTLAACGGGSDDSADTTAPTATTAPVETDPATTVPATTVPVPATTEPATTAAATTTPESTVPVTTEAPPETEAEWAESALFTLDDFAEGWTAVPSDPEDDEDDAEMQAMLAECSGIDPALLGEDVTGDNEATSPEFVSPDETATVSHTIGFAEDETSAVAAITAIGNEAIPDCYVQAINALFEDMQSGEADPSDTFPPGVTITDVTVDRVDLTGVAADDEVVWYATTVTLEYEGQSLAQYLDLILLRQGRVLSQVQLTSEGAEFPRDLVDPIVGLAIERASGLTEV